MSDARYDERHDRDELTPAQREFAGALGALRPAAPAGISRDRLLFEAGAAAARRSVFRWRAAAAVLMLGNAMLMGVALRSGGAGTGGGTSIVQAPVDGPGEMRPTGTEAANRTAIAEERPLVVDAARNTRWPSRAAGGGGGGGYLSVRDAVLRDGLAGLPVQSVRAVSDEKPLDVEELLGT